MIRRNRKLLAAAGIFTSALIFNACNPQERAFATGVGVGVVAASVYSYLHYYGHPYYYYDSRYYYGGMYYFKGLRFRNGHYYHSGYRYHLGHRYRARVGEYDYYQNRKQYDNRYRYR